MDAAEVLRAKSAQPEQIDGESNDKEFAILANVVWEELARAIQDEIGGSVFSAGKPDEFRKVNDTWTQGTIIID